MTNQIDTGISPTRDPPTSAAITPDKTTLSDRAEAARDRKRKLAEPDLPSFQVYDGRLRLGYVRARGDAFEALTDEDRSLGDFPDRATALAALLGANHVRTLPNP